MYWHWWIIKNSQYTSSAYFWSLRFALQCSLLLCFCHTCLLHEIQSVCRNFSPVNLAFCHSSVPGTVGALPSTSCPPLWGPQEETKESVGGEVQPQNPMQGPVWGVHAHHGRAAPQGSSNTTGQLWLRSLHEYAAKQPNGYWRYTDFMKTCWKA